LVEGQLLKVGVGRVTLLISAGLPHGLGGQVEFSDGGVAQLGQVSFNYTSLILFLCPAD